MASLRWPDLRNARDLGGIAVAGGGRIRERALIRTDNHGRLNADGMAAVRAYGVSRVVDLRWTAEAAEYPSPFAGDERYRLVPACFEATGGEQYPPDSYNLMIDRSRDRLAAVIGAIAQAPAGGVVVHCRHGRDRTGVVVALALHAAGVPVEAIAADFALSAASPPEMVTNTFAHLDSRYGGATSYLLSSGVTPAHLAAIRERLT